MQILTPSLADAANAAEAKKDTFAPSAPVEAGEYDMVIKTAPKVLTSKAGNAYLQLMLVHTGDLAKGTTAVYPSFNLNEIGNRQFSQLLLSLGISKADVAGAGWGIASDEADEKGRKPAVIAINGDTFSIEGRTVRVYLTKKESDYNGKTTVKNEVSRFVIS